MAKRIKPEDVPALRFQIGELFTPSSPVNVAELFAGRQKQILQLVDAVAEPGRHAIIYGERGVGKTSIAQIIEFLLPNKNRTVVFDRTPCDPSDTFTSIWKKKFNKIRFEVEVEGKIEKHSIDELYESDILPYNVVQEMKHFSLNDIPVFVIDEFNEVKDKETSVLMANTIKALSDDIANCTVVVVGVADNVVELFEEHQSIERCCEEVLMPRMSRDELREVVDKRLLQLGMTIQPDARWKVVVLSRGLPMYVHRLGKQSALRAVSDQRSEITEQDVDASIEEMLKSSLESLRNKYETATRSNQPGNLFQEVLLACAITKADDNGYFNPGAVREPLSRITKRSVQIAQYQSHLNTFASEKRGNILQKIGQERAYRFRFREPAMQPYVIMKGFSEQLISGDLKTILSFPEQDDLFQGQL